MSGTNAYNPSAYVMGAAVATSTHTTVHSRHIWSRDNLGCRVTYTERIVHPDTEEVSCAVSTCRWPHQIVVLFFLFPRSCERSSRRAARARRRARSALSAPSRRHPRAVTVSRLRHTCTTSAAPRSLVGSCHSSTRKGRDLRAWSKNGEDVRGTMSVRFFMSKGATHTTTQRSGHSVCKQCMCNRSSFNTRIKASVSSKAAVQLLKHPTYRRPLRPSSHGGPCPGITPASQLTIAPAVRDRARLSGETHVWKGNRSSQSASVIGTASHNPTRRDVGRHSAEMCLLVLGIRQKPAIAPRTAATHVHSSCTWPVDLVTTA